MNFETKFFIVVAIEVVAAQSKSMKVNGEKEKKVSCFAVVVTDVVAVIAVVVVVVVAAAVADVVVAVVLVVVRLNDRD